MARSGQTGKGGSVPVSRMPVQQREALARDEATPAETLAKLATDKSLYVRGALARNPATPAEVLVKLFNRGDEPYVDYQLAQNKNLPAEVVVGLAERHLMEQDPGSNGRHLLAMLKPLISRDPVPVALLETLARSASPVVQEEVAKHPATPPELLVSLAEPRERALGVWMMAVRNPSFPLAELEKVAAETSALGGHTSERKMLAREVAEALAARQG